MKVSELLTEIATKVDCNATETARIGWINELERKIYRNNLMETEADTMDTVADQSEYSLASETYAFEDIISIMVDGVPYLRKFSLDTVTESTYTYCKSSDGFLLTPTPLTASTGGIIIQHYKVPTLKTSASKTTDDLSIIKDFKADEHIDLYLYFLLNKCHLDNKEFSEANNYATLYNTAEREFWEWYLRNMATDMADYRKRRWR